MSRTSSSSPPRSPQAGARWRSLLLGRTLLVSSFTVLLALTLAPKVVHYAHVEFDPVLQQETAVEKFLKQQGWVRIGSLDLTLDGDTHAARYLSPACGGEIRVAVLSPIGQDAGLVNRMLAEGDRLIFIAHGMISESPLYYSPLRERLGRLSQSLHLSLLSPSPYLAVAAPRGCQVQTDVPWSSL